MNTETDTIARHVTLEDVRAVIESDPTAKSCFRIREALGRGSFATIQRHLETLRAAAAKPEPVLGEMPPVTEDVKRSLKALLTTTADMQEQMMRCIAERDSARKAADVSAADVAAFAVDADRLIGELDAAQATAQQAQAALESAQQMLKEQATAHAAALEQEQERRASELSAAKADAVYQEALRGELDRRMRQIMDLQAALQKRA